MKKKHVEDDGLLRYMELLRYGPTASRKPGTVYASVSQIAKMVKLSPTQARYMLKLGAEGRKQPSKRKPGPAL